MFRRYYANARFFTAGILLLILLFLSPYLSALPAREEQSDEGAGVADASGTADPGDSRAAFDPGDYAAFVASAPLTDNKIPAEFRNQRSPAAREFRGDFSRALVSFSEVLSGGPPKDGIPAINDPAFISPEEANWLKEQESVLVYEGNNVIRVYPVQILTYHEIVNDVLDGLPVAITYCPLCNTGVAFASLDHQGMPLDFGVSGRLRYSNMIMYDRQTESWWQQATGLAITGVYAGSELQLLPLQLVSWIDAIDLASQTGKQIEVLSQDTGYNRSYGRNPYPGYDSNSNPFLYRGPELDDSFSPTERVLSVKHGGEWGYAVFSQLERDGFAETEVAGDPVLFVYGAPVNSPLDSSSVSGGRDVGSARVYLARHDGEKLSFSLRSDGLLEDQNTGSVWTHQGIAQSGPLAGVRLSSLPAVNHFWFSWSSLVLGSE